MMNKLNMKIQGYDEASGSILVSFSTDQSMKLVDDYPILAVQPHHFDAGDPATILKNIAATSGLSTAISQDRVESATESPNVAIYKSMIGQTLTYLIDDLRQHAPPPPVNELNNMTDVMVD